MDRLNKNGAFRELLPSERMFSNGANPGVITPPPMSKEQRENLRREWENLYTGLVDVSRPYTDLGGWAWIDAEQ